MNKIFSSFKQFALSIIKAYRKQIIIPIKMSNDSLQKINIEYNQQRFYGPQKYFCYAPFGSLFISYSGKVAPCYACKIDESLEYKSLLEIWNGEIFQSLRSDFMIGIIPEACSFCKDHLFSNDYGSILANKYDHYLMSSAGMPVIAELELSNKCNLECIMCSGTLSSSIRKNRENLPDVINKLPENFIHQFEPILKQLKSLELTGGDPLIIDIYYDILNRAQIINPKIDVLITTNANTYNINTETLLNKGMNLSFNVSIDSLVETTYSKIRCNGSLKTAIKNIDTFNGYTKKYKTSLGFLVCPLKDNWEELPDFVEFANKYKATLSYHVVFKPFEHALWSLHSSELQKIYEHLSSFCFKGYDFYSSINVRSYNSVVKLIEGWYKKAILREKNHLAYINELNEKINIAKEKLKLKLDDLGLLSAIADSVEALIVDEYKEIVYLALEHKTKAEITEGIKMLSRNELDQKLLLYHREMISSFFYNKNLSDNDKYLQNTY